MKKRIMIILPLLLILMAFSKSKSGKLINTPNIDLESKLTQPATVVVETGCTATFFSTVEIKYPESTLQNPPTAFFKIKFSVAQKDLLFSVAQINNAFVRDYSPTFESQKFDLTSGKSLLLKLKFLITNKDVDFNKAILIEAHINPIKNMIHGKLVPTFEDLNTTNNLLSQLIVIGSPNTICYKCIETDDFPEHVMHSFFIPLIDRCQKSPAFLSNTSTTAELKQAVNPGTTFEFVNNGVIANTTIKTVLIKNNQGQFLTYSNNIPRFMDRIINDIHNYQDWVILKSTRDGCGDNVYKLIQYLDGNTCKELIKTRSNINYSRFFLSYRNGISEGNISEKIIIAAYGPTVLPDPH